MAVDASLGTVKHGTLVALANWTAKTVLSESVFTFLVASELLKGRTQDVWFFTFAALTTFNVRLATVWTLQAAHFWFNFWLEKI